MNNILLGFWIFYNNNQENNTDLANELRKNNIDRPPSFLMRFDINSHVISNSTHCVLIYYFFETPLPVKIVCPNIVA